VKIRAIESLWRKKVFFESVIIFEKSNNISRIISSN
jgi:hypothetical protein